MPRFKSLSSDDLDVYMHGTASDSFQVAAGAEIEIPGGVAEETEDAYIVGEGDAARAWPKSTWVVVAPAAKAVKEN